MDTVSLWVIIIGAFLVIVGVVMMYLLWHSRRSREDVDDLKTTISKLENRLVAAAPGAPEVAPRPNAPVHEAEDSKSGTAVTAQLSAAIITEHAEHTSKLKKLEHDLAELQTRFSEQTKAMQRFTEAEAERQRTNTVRPSALLSLSKAREDLLEELSMDIADPSSPSGSLIFSIRNPEASPSSLRNSTTVGSFSISFPPPLEVYEAQSINHEGAIALSTSSGFVRRHLSCEAGDSTMGDIAFAISSAQNDEPVRFGSNEVTALHIFAENLPHETTNGIVFAFSRARPRSIGSGRRETMNRGGLRGNAVRLVLWAPACAATEAVVQFLSEHMKQKVFTGNVPDLL